MQPILRLLLLLSLAPSLCAQLLPEISEPPQNPTTPEKVQLGTALFWEEQLSSNDRVACGTCHRWEHGGGDPRTTLRHPGADMEFGTEDDRVGSPGLAWIDAAGESMLHPIFGRDVQVTGRRARTPINAAFFGELFWDGRARDEFIDPLTGEIALEHSAALESQAIEPLMNDAEMAHNGRDWNHVVSKLGASQPLALASFVPQPLSAWIDGRSYGSLFEEAFGDPAITPTRIAMAMGAYERTLLSDQAPVLLDDDESGFEWTQLEDEGRFLFENLACATCHPPDDGLFTDGSYHLIGVRPRSEDTGLAEISEMPEDRGFFLTPSLLNVSLRAPYFHDGSKATLSDVIDFYDRGGDFGPREINEIGLSDRQKSALLAYLERPLTDPRLVPNEGPFVRPRLSTETKNGDTTVTAAAALAMSTPANEAPPTRVARLTTHGDTQIIAGFDGEVSVASGLTRIVAGPAGGTIERVVLEGGDLELTSKSGAEDARLSIEHLLAFEDGQVNLNNVRLTGALAVLSGASLTLDVDGGSVPGDWSGAGTLRLRGPDNDAFLRRGPNLGGDAFQGTLELVRGFLVPAGRDATQALYAKRVILGSRQGRGSLFRPFEAVDFLPDDMPLVVYDGALFLGFQESETFGPLSLFGPFEIALNRDFDRFQPPTNLAEYVFADCSQESWTVRGELILRDWFDGESDANQGPDRVVFRGLREDQLSKIFFVDPVGYPAGRYPARRLDSGELVPQI